MRLTGIGSGRMLRSVGIQVLGPTTVDDSQSLSPRDRTVLGALVVDRGSVTAPDRLAEALWGEDVPGSWRKVVQNSVVRLRRALGPAAIETTSDGYRLALGADDVDAWRFEHLLATAQSLAQVGESDRVAYTLDRALGLWRGEPLQDLDGWPPASAEVGRLQELRRSSEEHLAEALLDVGEHEQVIPRARALAAAEPLRERRWEILALALYRSGRQAEALRALSHARRTLRDELGIEPRAELVALEQAMLDQDPALATPAARGAVSERCPYKGLEVYDVDDADWFFGREAIVEACRRRLAQVGALVVAGGSGSGKSSLVRAGLVPRVRGDGRAVALCTPGADPAAAVATALSVTGSDAALVVDQAEEVFTLCHDVTKRNAFAATIADHAARRPVVMVLRADHIASTAAHRELSRMVEDGLFLLGAMNENELRDAIEEPARLAGCRLESGLVDLLVRDVLDEPGALPLLSHALVETWTRREGSVLTVAGYRDAGGVRGAVARTAERLYEALPESQRVLARALFLRLVETTEHDVVRHPVPMRALGEEPEQRAVVDTLSTARLITVGQDTVEIAHEALASAWPRLRGWLQEDREGQRMRQHLAAAAAEWEACDRDPSELYRGARLRTALDWASTADASLTSVERAFLDAGAERERTDAEVLREQAQTQARSNRRLRRSLAAVAVLLVCALVAGAIAIDQSARAGDERDRAEATARATAVQNLASQSRNLRNTKRDLAALLAVAGYRLAPGPETESALFATFTGSPGFVGHLHGADAWRSGMFLPGGHALALVDSAGELRVFDADRLTETEYVTISSAGVVDAAMAVSRDGSTLAVAVDTGDEDAPSELRVLDPTTLQPGFDALPLDFAVRSLAVSPDGRLVAVSGGDDARVEIRDARTGALAAAVDAPPAPTSAPSEGPTAALAFAAPDRLVIASHAGAIRTIDAGTGRELDSIEVDPNLAGPVYAGDRGQAGWVVRLTADGRTAVTSGPEGTMRWDLSTGRPLWRTPAGPQGCRSFAIVEAPDARVICGVDTYAVALDLETGVTRPERYEGNQNMIGDLAISADGRVLAAIIGTDLEDVQDDGASPTATIWRVDGTGPVHRKLGTGPLVPGGYNPEGDLLQVREPSDTTGPVRQAPVPLDPNHDQRVIDPETGAVVDELDEMAAAFWAGRGDVLVGLCTDGAGCRYDLARDARPRGGRSPGELGIAVPAGILPDGAHERVIVWDFDGHVRAASPDGSPTSPSFDIPATGPEFFSAWTLGVSPDGRTLVGTSFEHGLHSWDVATGERTAGPLPDYVIHAMSPDGEVVAWTQDSRIRLFDPRTLEPLSEQLPASFGRILYLWFSADGQRVLIASGDGAYRLVDWPSFSLLGDPIPFGRGIPGPWSYPDLRSDGEEMVLPGLNGVTVWDLDTETWLDRACALAGRDLTEAEWQQYLGAFGPQQEICA
jgi:DNA-binding SARP family transcriptional activator/WD40 repeat protein